MFKWTKDQQKAINIRNANLLVTASAGSGKTAVLVERVIQLIIKDQVDIDKLLIVTFTKAAAGEMRERISSAILAELEKGCRHEEHLRRQIELLSRASISTLHSFCSNVVREYFYLLEIDPGVKITDQTETRILKQEALKELFEMEYQKASEQFLGLVDRFGGSKSDIPLEKLVLELYEFVQSQPNPQEWLVDKVNDFALQAGDLEKSSWVQSLQQEAVMALSTAQVLFQQALEITQRPGGPEGYQEALLNDLSIVNNLSQALKQGMTASYQCWQGIQFKRLGRASRDSDEGLREEVKSLREEARKIIKGIKEILFGKSLEQFLADLHELYPFMDCLQQLVAEFTWIYQAKKLEKGLMDFNDLEHYALAILSRPDVAREYRDKYYYIFVDEYQDSNRIQENILNLIKKENNLFMVGDVKQSIYRFRLADPSIFMEKYDSFGEGEKYLNRRIFLGENFRSRREIIDAVNYLFRKLMSRYCGEIDYDDKACLYPGMPIAFSEHSVIVPCPGEKSAELGKKEEGGLALDGSIALYLLEKDPEEILNDEEGEIPSDVDLELEKIDDLRDLQDIEAEACLVVQCIKGLLGKPFYDVHLGDYRKIEYKDIVILLRSTRNWAQTFVETLSYRGLPAYADINTGYFAAVEVDLFINLLRVIDNKRQDIPLLGVMRSPIGKFTIEDLIKIRMSSQAVSFFEALEDFLEKDEESSGDDLRKRAQAFLIQLNDWKDEARYMPMDEFIWKVLMDTGYYYYVGAMPGGAQRQANLRVLLDRTRQFQNSTRKGLFQFINFIDHLHSASDDLGAARMLGENDNVIRIMSIHKSKGLEFPVVILAGLGKQFNFSDINPPVLFHKDLGLGPRYVDPCTRTYSDTIARLAMKKRIKLENLSEEMRILYVGCTRAQEKLILVGSQSKLEKAAQRWVRGVDPFWVAQGRSFLDWIALVLIHHPDGGQLRELAGFSPKKEELFQDPSRWQVEIVHSSELQTQRQLKEEWVQKFVDRLREKPSEANPKNRGIISSSLDWQYKHKRAAHIPSKLSVTAIKKLKYKELQTGLNNPPLVSKPSLVKLDSEWVTPILPGSGGLEKGNIMHLVLRHLDLTQVQDEAAISKQIQEMVSRELLRGEETSGVDVAAIARFFRSDLGQRVVKAKKVYREIPFNLLSKAEEVMEVWRGCQDQLLIQGVIDLYFWEGDQLVLVDYKTDRILPERREEIISGYTVQLKFYKRALESILGHQVKESYLYFFERGEMILVS